ncbi:terminase [Yersinia phage vB_YpM_MHG96]
MRNLPPETTGGASTTHPALLNEPLSAGSGMQPKSILEFN